MPAIVPIVEGDGEKAAFPLLLRRLLYDQERYDFTVTSPYNARGRTKLTRSGGIEAYLSYAASEPDAAGIIVLLDLEDDNCAADLARELAARARNVYLNLPVAIVVVVQAYEAWFLASIETIRGQPIKRLPFFPDDVEPPPEPEAIRSPKGWLKDRLVDDRFYKEKEDMPPLTDLLDCAQVRQSCRSFRRLDHAIGQLIAAVDRQDVVVTP